MVIAITDGIKISVDTNYLPKDSDPTNGQFIFVYRIKIENLSNFTIQLMRRQWFIFDSNNTHHNVEGEGVVGKQPIIEAGDTYIYSSFCVLKTAIGNMHGQYLVRRLDDDILFPVEIPKFQMIVPYLLN